MKSFIKFLIVVLIIVVLISVLVIISKKNKKVLIKMDACVSVCKSEFRYISSLEDTCREECREEYGITWEKYNTWKEKNKNRFDIP